MKAKTIAICIGLFSVGTGNIVAADLSLEQRLERVERVLQTQSDLLLKTQQLQRELQQLRGELELQGNTIEALNRKQQQMYLDLEQRIGQPMPAASPADSIEPQQLPETAAPVTPATSVSKKSLPEAGDPALEKPSYDKAFDLLRTGKYPQAISAFTAFLGQYPTGNYSDNAQYWLGEAYYVTQDYDNALQAFQILQERYGDSQKMAGAMLKTGYIQHEKKQTEQALQTLNQVIQKYPGSTEAHLAEQRLKRIR